MAIALFLSLGVKPVAKNVSGSPTRLHTTAEKRLDQSDDDAVMSEQARVILGKNPLTDIFARAFEPWSRARY
jgi:hypothetical protein